MHTVGPPPEHSGNRAGNRHSGIRAGNRHCEQPGERTGRGAEPVGALEGTARRLKAAFAFIFFALVALAVPENAHAAKTVTISTASTTITEGDSGKKDVTINVKLGEGTPAILIMGFRFLRCRSAAVFLSAFPFDLPALPIKEVLSAMEGGR